VRPNRKLDAGSICELAGDGTAVVTFNRKQDSVISIAQPLVIVTSNFTIEQVYSEDMKGVCERFQEIDVRDIAKKYKCGPA
jgi:hypothetical protein